MKSETGGKKFSSHRTESGQRYNPISKEFFIAAIEIPDELTYQIEHASQRAYSEGLEDIAIATERTNNPGEPISLEQLKKDLGIEE